MKKLNRRDFVKTTAMGSIGFGLSGNVTFLYRVSSIEKGKRVGIIGLDTSHVVAFTQTLNDSAIGAEYGGYKVVAAFPTKGSRDLPFSINRIASFTERVKKMGVEIVGSIEELLKKVDVVLLESVDGRPHYEQALPVLKAGKRMFIDKPISSSLSGAMAIFQASEKYKVPVFSSSATRFAPITRKIIGGELTGKILGCDTFDPAGGAEIGHPDLFFYGIHGVESLFTIMGPGCKSVVRFNTDNNDIVVGTWNEGKLGTFRGTPRNGKAGFGGTAFGETGIASIGEFAGYKPLLLAIVEFFQTGVAPVRAEETLELLAFMEAADVSKKNGGAPVSIESVMERAKAEIKMIS